jgi:hypothetical protein
MTDHYVVLGRLRISKGWKTLGRGSHKECLAIVAKYNVLIGSNFRSITLVHENKVAQMKRALEEVI